MGISVITPVIPLRKGKPNVYRFGPANYTRTKIRRYKQTDTRATDTRSSGESISSLDEESRSTTDTAAVQSNERGTSVLCGGSGNSKHDWCIRGPGCNDRESETERNSGCSEISKQVGTLIQSVNKWLENKENSMSFKTPENNHDPCWWTSENVTINPNAKAHEPMPETQNQIKPAVIENGVRLASGKVIEFKELKEALTLIRNKFSKWNCDDESDYCDEVMSAIDTRLVD